MDPVSLIEDHFNKWKRFLSEVDANTQKGNDPEQRAKIG